MEQLVRHIFEGPKAVGRARRQIHLPPNRRTAITATAEISRSLAVDRAKHEEVVLNNLPFAITLSVGSLRGAL